MNDRVEAHNILRLLEENIDILLSKGISIALIEIQIVRQLMHVIKIKYKFSNNLADVAILYIDETINILKKELAKIIRLMKIKVMLKSKQVSIVKIRNIQEQERQIQIIDQIFTMMIRRWLYEVRDLDKLESGLLYYWLKLNTADGWLNDNTFNEIMKYWHEIVKEMRYSLSKLKEYEIKK